MSKIISTTIRIEEELMNQLKEMKEERGIPISEIIRRAIIHYLRESKKNDGKLHSSK